jgi:hypothetical protein
MKAWSKQIKKNKATEEEPSAAIAVRLSAKSKAIGGSGNSSSSGSRGAGIQAHSLGGYFHLGANNFGYYPFYSQFSYPF